MVCYFDRANDGRISDCRKQRYQLDAEHTSADVRSVSLETMVPSPRSETEH